MTRTPEGDFAKAHALFDHGHSKQRAQLLSALATFKDRPASPSKWRMIPLPLRLTAAGLFIAAAGALLTLSPGGHAYGIEDLRDRLLTIRSLHIKGWIYQYPKTEAGELPVAFPTETYFERPCRRYGLSYGFAFDVGGKMEVTTRATMSDGKQSMLIDHDKKTVTSMPVDELQTELMVENQLQGRLFEMIEQGDLGHFKKVGSDRIKGVVCDTYDHIEIPNDQMKFRTRIWLNPRNGMPVKIACYDIEPDGTEMIFWERTEIRINVDPPKDMFSFEPPPGYEKLEVTEKGDEPRIAVIGGGGGMVVNGKQVSVSSGVAFSIDDKAALYCWAIRTKDKEGVKWFDGEPEFTIDDAEKRTCDEITLRTDDLGDRQARWSLIVPRDRRPLGNATLHMIYRLGGSSSSMESTPLEFSAKRLADLVEKCQQRTLPPDHDAAEIWTLDEIRQRLTEAR